MTIIATRTISVEVVVAADNVRSLDRLTDYLVARCVHAALKRDVETEHGKVRIVSWKVPA